MTIDVLVCSPDGSRRVETREVPENYFAVAEGDSSQPLTEDKLPVE